MNTTELRIEEVIEDLLIENPDFVVPTEEEKKIYYSFVDSVVEFIKDDPKLLRGSFIDEDDLGFECILQSLESRKRIEFTIHVRDMSKVKLFHLGKENFVIRDEFDFTDKETLCKWCKWVSRID